MASLRPSRLLFAAGLAIAVSAGPAVAVLGGQVAPSAPRTLADQAGCVNIGHKNSPSLQCAPGQSANGPVGLPNEQQLTDQNSQRHH
jgi:hypothetical protein